MQELMQELCQRERSQGPFCDLCWHKCPLMRFSVLYTCIMSPRASAE
jgi:hypothetical protein